MRTRSRSLGNLHVPLFMLYYVEPDSENIPTMSIKQLPLAEQVRKTQSMVDRNGYKEYFFKEKEDVEAEASSDSSSIGVLSSSSSIHEDERGDEVQSKLKDEGLFVTLTSLEETLPIKRGLSNFFSGKSKSFASLAEASSCNATDLVKPENSFNKRRRVLVSCKASWRGRASCTSIITSFPPFICPGFVKEDDVENEDEEVEQKWGRGFPFAPIPSLRKRFRNPGSHSFSDLQKI